MPFPIGKLTQDQAKLHNRRLVLKIIYEAGGISRAGIARATGLTRTTSSSAVAELMEDGLVVEAGQGVSAGGKPPTLLRFVDDARYVVGVDLAGFHARGGVFDLRGKAVHRLMLPMQPSDGDAALAVVFDLIDRLIDLADRPLLGIGIGLPGLMDAQQGIIHRAVNLGWRELPLGDLLKGRYDLPIYLVNDSQAAALGQFSFANQERVNDLAVVLVGRGISAGLVIGGRLYLGGSHSGASEIGHVRVVEGGQLCACGHFGCLETVASQDAVLRWARTVFANDPDSKLHRFAPTSDDIDIEVVVQAYQAGDATLACMVAQVGRHLGTAVANLVGVSNVPLVVLTGNVARFGDALLDTVVAEMQQRLYAPLARRTRVKISELGQDIVMLGAAALLLSNELGVVGSLA